ncbi:twitching mobility protein [Anaerotignum neopropionicum]|uniref:Twitching mobility protein n=1 Tax=Anaerotignum neopropionicum TaxID=36847 RepID=A0A136WFG0_9FIRM|nr:PilT/PilU family type 4a pilus ATPase [Anaerotignum neopropionicum]KXL53234.1 twitching mobility protein [Anaerotignum neopropionicum]
MLSFLEILTQTIQLGASDVFIVAGKPLSYKKGKIIYQLNEEKIMPDYSKQLVEEAYGLAHREVTRLSTDGDDDFAISVPNLARLRVNCYKQRGSLAAVLRIVSYGIPNYQSIGIPEEVMKLAKIQKGLVLVTGSAGNGKSTTLACILQRINETRTDHIITLEDPIEFLYRNDKSIISQREIGLDTLNFVSALRSSLRQSPDVILVGEMRDHETIQIAMTAAETGHLILSTLHTVGAVSTIDRIIDIFPPNQQQQVRVQLSMVLKTVVSQQLVPSVDDSLIPVFEIMHMNNAVRNMIRESKVYQIESVIGMSGADGMISMDNSLYQLAVSGKITIETALQYAIHSELLEKRFHMNLRK